MLIISIWNYKKANKLKEQAQNIINITAKYQANQDIDLDHGCITATTAAASRESYADEACNGLSAPPSAGSWVRSGWSSGKAQPRACRLMCWVISRIRDVSKMCSGNWVVLKPCIASQGSVNTLFTRWSVESTAKYKMCSLFSTERLLARLTGTRLGTRNLMELRTVKYSSDCLCVKYASFQTESREGH